MSYGITAEGFVAKELTVIVAECIDRINQLIERCDLRSDSPVRKILDVVCEREGYLWDVTEDLYGELSGLSATGEYLKMFLSEEGMLEGSAEKAVGTISITGLASGSDIPIGSKFSTNEGTEFETIEAASLVNKIQMTRATGFDMDDPIPSPYSSASLDFVSQFSDGTGIFDPSTYSFASDVLTWSTPPAGGTTYYIWLTNEITVDVSVQAVDAGTGGNVPANTVTVDNSGISDITSVNNSAETTYGSDEEDDESARNRYRQTRHRNWVLNNIKADVDSIAGVRASKVYQNEAVDQYNPNDWTAGHSPYTATVDVDSAHELGQTFASGARVITLSGVTVRGRKIGAPSPLRCEVYYWKGNYVDTVMSTLMTEGELRSDEVDPNDPWVEQDLKIPLKFGGLDSSLRYLIRLTSPASTSGKWELLYENDDTYDYGIMYRGGTGVVGGDLWFKTQFWGASFTSKLALERTYTWPIVSANVESKIDDEGKKAVAITSVVSQAIIVRINVGATIYLGDGYSQSTVFGNIETAIRAYIENLGIGDDIYWSRIHTIISSTEGVTRIYDLLIKRDNLSWTDGDITILDGEVATLDDGTYGPGTAFTIGG